MVKGNIKSAKATWRTRNDSSKVGSLLNPLQPNEDPERPNQNCDGNLTEEPSKTDAQTRLVVVSDKLYQRVNPLYRCKNCYCKKQPMKPKHVDSLQDTMGYRYTVPEAKSMRRMNRRRGFLYDNNAEEYYSNSMLRNCYLCEPCNSCQTQNFENRCNHWSSNVDSRNMAYVEKGIYDKLTDSLSANTSPTNSPRSNNIPSPMTSHRSNKSGAASAANSQKSSKIEPKTKDSATSPKSPMQEACTCKFLKSNNETNVSLQKLHTFLKENYYGRASIEPPIPTKHTSAPEHTCLHKFVLNDRLLPLPVNPDSFGMSMCSVCNKSLQDYNPDTSIRLIPQQGLAEKEKRPSILKAFQKEPVMPTPTTINIVNKKNKIEIKIPTTLNETQSMAKNVKFKQSPQVPTNSLALRHQKGIANK